MKDRLNLSLKQEQKYFEEENGKMIALKISPKVESLHGLGRQATNLKGFVWNFSDFCKASIWTIFY